MIRIRLKESRAYTVKTVGVSFWNAKTVIAPGEYFDEFDLVPEPDNPHDEKAIAVVYNGRKIGYIPRGQNEVIWTSVARITAKGNIACAKGRVRWDHTVYDFPEVLLYIHDTGLPDDTSQLAPVLSNLTLPPRYEELSANNTGTAVVEKPRNNSKKYGNAHVDGKYDALGYKVLLVMLIISAIGYFMMKTGVFILLQG